MSAGGWLRVLACVLVVAAAVSYVIGTDDLAQFAYLLLGTESGISLAVSAVERSADRGRR